LEGWNAFGEWRGQVCGALGVKAAQRAKGLRDSNFGHRKIQMPKGRSIVALSRNAIRLERFWCKIVIENSTDNEKNALLLVE
jgi:hypothetical protein